MVATLRIDTDTNYRTNQVQNSSTGISRGPIFHRIKILLMGWLLTIPYAASLPVLVLGQALINIQVQLEEYLLYTHGDVYRDYQQMVRRWI